MPAPDCHGCDLCDRCEAELQRAAGAEQAGYDRAIRDVVSFLRVEERARIIASPADLVESRFAPETSPEGGQSESERLGYGYAACSVCGRKDDLRQTTCYCGGQMQPFSAPDAPSGEGLRDKVAESIYRKNLELAQRRAGVERAIYPYKRLIEPTKDELRELADAAIAAMKEGK